jgi:hypothetical protein
MITKLPDLLYLHLPAGTNQAELNKLVRCHGCLQRRMSTRRSCRHICVNSWTPDALNLLVYSQESGIKHVSDVTKCACNIAWL